MQGFDDGQRELLLDVEALAGHMLVPGSVFAFLAEHRSRLFPVSMFEDLFPPDGAGPTAHRDRQNPSICGLFVSWYSVSQLDSLSRWDKLS
jgi:hypothetical protein